MIWYVKTKSIWHLLNSSVDGNGSRRVRDKKTGTTYNKIVGKKNLMIVISEYFWCLMIVGIKHGIA